MRSRTAIAVLLLILLPCLLARHGIADDDGPLTDADYEPAVIDRLIETLRTGDTDARYHAGDALQLRGPDARVAIPEFVSVIVNDKESFGPYGMFPLSSDAGMWLNAIGRDAIPAATEALNADDPSLRITALMLLSRYGPESAAALPHILLRFDVANSNEAAHIVDTVASLDETGAVAVPFLRSALSHDDKYIRERAIVALDATIVEGGTTQADDLPWSVTPPWQPPAPRWYRHQPELRADVVSLLLPMLEDPEPRVRGAAARVLGTYPEAHERILPALLRHLDDDEQYSVMLTIDMGSWESVRERVVEALGNFSDQADQLLPILIDSIPEEQSQPLTRLEHALEALAPHAETGVEQFSKLLDTDRWQRAVAPLGAIGPPARSTLPRLEQRLPDVERYQQMQIVAAILSIEPQHARAGEMVREWHAIENAEALYPLWSNLERMGPRAAPLVPLLLPHIKRDKYLSISSGITGLLQAIGPDAAPAIPKLIDDLGHWDSGDSRQTLVQIGPASVPQLIEVLRDEATEPAKVVDALKVLGQLKRDAATAFSDVVRLTASQYPNVREAAVSALGSIGDRSQAMPPLLRALEDPRPLVRRAAVLSLGRFPDPDEATIAALSHLLNDEFLEVQFAVCQKLGDFAPHAGSAIAALEAYRDVGNAHQQHVARRALQRIRGE